MTYRAPGIPDINALNILEALGRIKEIIEVREGLRGSSESDRYLTLGRLTDQAIDCLRVRPQDGISGWFDDGANFRVTLTKGIVTGIAASSGAGYHINT